MPLDVNTPGQMEAVFERIALRATATVAFSQPAAAAALFSAACGTG
jgi:hypothetical protein